MTGQLRKRISRAVIATAGALALLTGMAGAAFAQYPPAANLSVSCTPENPAPGDDVVCRISGAPAHAGLSVLVEINPVLLESTHTTDADGTAGFSFTVPSDASHGDVITITVGGRHVTGTMTLQLTVTDPEPVPVDEDVVAVTGANSATLLVAGVVVVAVGAAAVGFGRRRERARAGV